jgi:Na+-transporting NADH:ubiquinone oxidoreductase subunit D
MSETTRHLTDPIVGQNPVTVQILGICSALAVTTSLTTALVMCAALTAVLTLASGIISALRAHIPQSIRLIVQITIIAALVIVVDEFLKAYAFEISKRLSVFVGLIITNCIVMGRAEAFAMQNPPFASFLDGLGNGLGYSVILLVVATAREILGAGTWFGMSVLPAGYPGNGLAMLAPGAFIIIGLIIWIQRTMIKKFETD